MLAICMDDKIIRLLFCRKTFIESCKKAPLTANVREEFTYAFDSKT